MNLSFIRISAEYKTVLPTELRMRRLEIKPRDKISSSKKESHVYDTKLRLMVRQQFGRVREYGITPLLSLCSRSLRSGEFVPLMVTFKGQIVFTIICMR